MTAEKFLNKWITKPLDYNDIENLMIEFARYHVEQALKEASEKAELYRYNNGFKQSKANIKEEYCFTYRVAIDKETILNAYPLENIK